MLFRLGLPALLLLAPLAVDSEVPPPWGAWWNLPAAPDRASAPLLLVRGVGAPGACALDEQIHAGAGTYYDPAREGPGNCGFPATPDEVYVVAINQTDYAGSAACGACVAVDGPEGSVTARVVNRCPECQAGDLDLSPAAFARLAPPARGRVPVRWRYVTCPVAGPLAYHFKDGSNPWWTAVQVRNHRTPIAALEVRAPDGQYRALPRLDYNYFVAERGLGRGPYDVRVTDALGRAMEDRGVPLAAGEDVAGGGQFAGCGS